MSNDTAPADAGEQALSELGADQGESGLAALQGCIEAAVASGQPVLVGKGLYSLYATPEGGLHLAYRPEGAIEDGHLPVPPGLMRMALAKGEGAGALTQIRSLFGGF